MSGIDKTDVTKGPMPDSAATYFANLPTHEFAMACWDRIEGYYNEMRRTGRLALYRNSYTNFYQGWIYRASMYKSGEMGELTRSFINHERNLLLHLKVQTTQNKVAYKAQVRNSSAQAAQLIEFANGLSEHYAEAEEFNVNGKGEQAVEDCLVFAQSAIAGLWNRFAGEPVVTDPATGVTHYEGDMDYFNVTPMDDIFNTTHQSIDQRQWRIIRRWVNKFDWAAMYPTFADRVKGLGDTESTYGTKLVSLIRHDEETIPVFYCFHEKTPAVKQGRLLIMADPQCVFEDGPLDRGPDRSGYDHIPVYDMMVCTMGGSPFGYTVAFDLIPPQQLFNELYSAVATNNINFATQLILGPKGANFHYQGLASGMSYMEYDPKMGPQQGKPEPLQLTHSAPETYQLMDKTVSWMETISGVNSLQRGQVDANITSGQYAALVYTQSVIFNSSLQSAYARLMSTTMTGTIRTLRKNMVAAKAARITGSSQEAYVREFQKADLLDIESVGVDLANPMLQTPAGKMNMADNLMKTGLIKDAQQYIGVYTEGDLPMLYHRQETQLKLIKQENEALMKGIKFDCAVTDNHVSHILEHTAIIDTMEARLNPNLPYVVAALLHIQCHLNKLAGGTNPFTGQPEGAINPILAGIIGDPALPPGTPNTVQLAPAVPGAPGGSVPPPAGGPPKPGASGPAQPQSPPQMPSQPSQMAPAVPGGQPQPVPVGGA